MEFTAKYYGILKGFDFENININTFKTLVESGIFNEYELSLYYIKDGDYFISNDDIMEFGDFFIQNRKEYHLKKEVLIEMIYVKKWYLEAFNDIDSITEEIEVLIASEFQLESKLQILEENFKKYFNEIKDKRYYSLFKDEISTGGYKSWEQYFVSHIVDDLNHKSIADFLNGKQKYLNNEIEHQWNEYFAVSKISDYCIKKKNSLLNIKENILEKHNNNIDLSFQISLLEEILNIKDWSEISATKKGEILSNLLGKNKDNIKKIYLEFNKKNSKISNKILDDRNKASEFIKKTLG